jgi:hypothetical protein
MADKKKFEKVQSPRGIAVYPKLDKPDFKFKAEGVYSCKVRCSAEDEKALALVKKIDAAMKKSLAAAKAEWDQLDEKEKKKRKNKAPVSADCPYVVDEDEGTITFTFSRKAKVTPKNGPNAGKTFHFKPTVFDAKLKPLPKGVEVWGGSEVRCAGEIVPFYTPLVGAGISLRLLGVQVFNLVSRGEVSGEALGFEAEDGFDASSLPKDGDEGFEGEGETAPPPEDGDAPPEGDGDPEDF